MESKGTVFVVDDDPEIRKSLTSLLQEVDLPVQTYDNAQEFLEGYDPTRQGCLVLDVRMPGMDGIALHKTLRARGITIPVIIITGHGDVGMAVEAVQRGALDLIEKPFRAQPLLERINQALAQDAEMHQQRAHRQATALRLALLTERQRQVMGLVVAGETTKSIAITLGISPKTVDHHRAQIMEKMQARNLIDLARMAQALGNGQQPSQHCHAGKVSS